FMPEGPAALSFSGRRRHTMCLSDWSSDVCSSDLGLALGMGNGAVFQLIPLRFRQDIGLMTGLVGCAGGVGGYFLAQALGTAKAEIGRASCRERVDFLVVAVVLVFAFYAFEA